MDGVLVINKPPGWTSHDVVAKIRNLTRIRKVGHTGTLDPFATGVLPLSMGRATRLTSYFLSSDKVYRGIIRFGFATTTFDLDGEACGEDTRPVLDRTKLEELFAKWVGNVRQTLPAFSAKKVRGRPMYAYARRGVDLGESTKEVTINSLNLISIQASEVEFELACAAGTYARSLAHDIGRDYGCGAHLVRLERVRSGEFPIESAVALGEGDTFYPREYFLGRIIPMRSLLPRIPAIVLTEADRERLVHGADLNLLTAAYDSPEYRLLTQTGELVAVAQRLQTFSSPGPQPVRWVRAHPKIIFA